MQPKFPGMNPYLENPELWTEIHAWLIVQLARSLNPFLTPKYRAAIERRVYSEAILVGIPDVSVFQPRTVPPRDKTATSTIAALPQNQPIKVNVPVSEEVQESYLEIRQVETGQVVTVVEVLSPKNKRSGEGQTKYNAKRTKILDSYSHLVEIDLLRAGQPQPVSVQVSSDYRILVSRSEDRPAAELYPFNLRDPIPQVSLPLLPQDSEPPLKLKQILDEIYTEALLDLAIDYSTQPIPPLAQADWEWMQTLLEVETDG